MDTLKITFVPTPAIRFDQNYGTLFGPMWAYTLAAYVPETWKSKIVDCSFEDPRTIESSDVFAFSGINQDIDSIRRVHDMLKAKYPKAVFVVGGPITWSLEQDGKLNLLDYFDHIFIMDGEETLPNFLNAYQQGEVADIPKIIRSTRFKIRDARQIRFDLYQPNAKNYYGALIEVSRGCPFLCEFCDIRVLPGNNQSHNKSIPLIIQEMDAYHKLGITQFQFACDNFIGDIAWARECVDAIIEWRKTSGAKASIFTWLTINLHKMPDLMEKMREAGFSIIFIGIESVNANSLLETAKVQNRLAMDEAIGHIQEFGFIIAPGFIFGFDSDTTTVFEDTLEFLDKTGLIGGDPSFLMALPGTPLFERMQRAGRLIGNDEQAIVREKITTNIRYLQDPEFLVNGFVQFIEKYTSADFQLSRFKNHINMIMSSETFIPQGQGGYGSPIEYMKLQFREFNRLKDLFKRITYILARPSVFIAVLKAWWFTRSCKKRYPGLGLHFNYWVYIWTNIGIKYDGLNKQDFAIYSVGKDFDIKAATRKEIDKKSAPAVAHVKGDAKGSHQERYTKQALERLVEEDRAS